MYQPKTGKRCACRPGVERDNCPRCEGTGWAIDFAKIRARKLSVPEQHQRRVAERTLKMPDAMVGVMGGMTKDEAIRVIVPMQPKGKV